MNNSGKTSTILLTVLLILFFFLSIISYFFYQKTTEEKNNLQSQLTTAKAVEAKLESDLKEAKKQVFLLEEKAKESDEKISGLMDELELQQGVKDQMKTENEALKEALKKENEDKESIHAELVTTQEKLAALETQLKSEEGTRTQLEAKVKEMETDQVKEPAEVDLEKIIVKPGEIPEGKVVKVNDENNFVVLNLGQEHGIKQDMLMSVYRKNNYLGDLKISRVQEGMSVADFVAPFTSKQVHKDDKVLVKK